MSMYGAYGYSGWGISAARLTLSLNRSNSLSLSLSVCSYLSVWRELIRLSLSALFLHDRAATGIMNFSEP